MTDMVRSMNPTATISNAGEAKAAARASAIAIFLGVIWGVIGLVWLMGPGAAVMEAAMAEAAASSPEAASMTGMMAGAAVGVTAFLIAIQLILGLVQWFKPNIVIPILFTILVVYGLGTAVLGLVMAGQMDIPAAAAQIPRRPGLLSPIGSGAGPRDRRPAAATGGASGSTGWPRPVRRISS